MEPPKERPGCILHYDWILSRPMWWPVYTCERFDNRTKDGHYYNDHIVFQRLENVEPIIMLWCVDNCKGRFTIFSDWMSGCEPGREEGYVFESLNDALLFKLTWGGQ